MSLWIFETESFNEDDYDDDEEFDPDFQIWKKVKIDLKDMDLLSWKRDLEQDKIVLNMLLLQMKQITPSHDSKLQKLLEIIRDKVNNPINIKREI